ncbi:hypothetical protein TWF730_002177 [Orbilia blumenaviensis]|uniref:Ribosome maturation protein SDO1/SBDS N-terminal domain-containing protein n=1 Tax=Orbilia blumenaviensis TaxID=1796055 RepID=A0AAV9UEN9_9PEZI
MRGAEKVNKVYLQRGGEDFIVLVEDKDNLDKWKTDTTISLTDVVNGFKIFTTHRQGAQGVLDSASNAILDASFGTHKVDDIIPIILREGQLQVTGGVCDTFSSLPLPLFSNSSFPSYRVLKKLIQICSQGHDRGSSTNDSKGSMANHR